MGATSVFMWNLMKTRSARTTLIPALLLLLLSLYNPLLGLGRFFGFLIIYTVGRTPWMVDQLVAGPLPTHRTAQTE
jgi:hypothetical protein